MRKLWGMDLTRRSRGEVAVGAAVIAAVVTTLLTFVIVAVVLVVANGQYGDSIELIYILLFTAMFLVPPLLVVCPLAVVLALWRRRHQAQQRGWAVEPVSRRHAAVAAVTVVALLSAGGAVARPWFRADTLLLEASDLRQGPDLTGRADAGLGEGVLAAPAARSAFLADVRWLYRGKVAIPDRRPAYVVMFTATSRGEPVVVTATSRDTPLDGHGRAAGRERWELRVTSLSTLDPLVGVFLPYTKGGKVRNVAIAVADPLAARMSWLVSPMSVLQSDFRNGPEGRYRRTGGVYSADLGEVTGKVEMKVTDEGGRREGWGRFATDPALVRPVAPDVPGGFRPSLIASGASLRERVPEGSPDDGFVFLKEVFTAPGYTLSRRSGGPLAGFVRCYGDGKYGEAATLETRLLDARGRTLSRGSVPCDNRTHSVSRSVPGSAKLVLAPSDWLAYSLALGSVTPG